MGHLPGMQPSQDVWLVPTALPLRLWHCLPLASSRQPSRFLAPWVLTEVCFMTIAGLVLGDRERGPAAWSLH